MKVITILIAAAAGVFIASPMQAAETTTGHESHGERLESFKEELNLTPEQVDQIRPILRKQREQVETVRENSSLTREQKLEKCREMIKSTAEEIRPLLKPEQREKLGQAVDKMREAVQARVGARGGEARVQE